jgi:hypothetical protein
MRVVVPSLAVAAVASLLVACPGPPAESCSQSTVLPTDDDVADGRGTATRSDGVAFDEAGSWNPTTLSVTIGTLDMTVPNDETGDLVADLIGAGAFPICIPIGARSEQTGSANLVDGGFVSDANHTGGVAILGRDGNTLLGRFSFDLATPSGTELTFSDGAFRLPQR